MTILPAQFSVFDLAGEFSAFGAHWFLLAAALHIVPDSFMSLPGLVILERLVAAPNTTFRPVPIASLDFRRLLL